MQVFSFPVLGNPSHSAVLDSWHRDQASSLLVKLCLLFIVARVGLPTLHLAVIASCTPLGHSAVIAKRPHLITRVIQPFRVVVGEWIYTSVIFGRGDVINLKVLRDHPGLPLVIVANKGGFELANAKLGIIERNNVNFFKVSFLHVYPCLVVGCVGIAGVGGPDADPGPHTVGASGVVGSVTDQGFVVHLRLGYYLVQGFIEKRLASVGRFAEGWLQGAQQEYNRI